MGRRLLHPFSDEWTDEYEAYAATASRVTYTLPLRRFIDDCRDKERRPVLVTEEAATLSPHLVKALADGGGSWAFRAHGGYYDASSGYRIGSFPELWRGPSSFDDRHRAYGSPSARSEGVFLFEVYASERAVSETRVGALAEHVIAGLGGRRAVDRWDSEEPLTRTWSVDAVTAVVRSEMPASGRYLLGTPDHAWANMAVARTRRGLLEHATGGVPAGPYASPHGIEHGVNPSLHPAVTETLTGLVDQFRPNVAMVSYGEYARTDHGVVRRVGTMRPDVPLAVLIGPRGVRDLRLDVDDLRSRHDVTVLGPGRVPSLLVRMSGRSSLWGQLAAFAYDLDQERLAAALAVEFEGGR